MACSVFLRAGEEDETMGEEPDGRFIIPFACAGEADYPRIGGKCTSLARMIAAGIRVPEGFAVTTDAYSLHLQAPGLAEIVRSTLASIDVENVADEERKSAEIRAAIVARAMPAAVEEAVRGAYRSMSPGDDLPVAVRSSATAEDLPDASFAGQQDTYLWVVGADEVVEKVRACWASLFNARAISYRAKRLSGHADILMSVAVQKMVDAAAAGVAMTLDPITGDRTKIVIDSAFGLGEPVVSGDITPDNFVVEKVLLEITRRHVISRRITNWSRTVRRVARSTGSSSRNGARSHRSRTRTSSPSRGSPSRSRNAWAGRRMSSGRSTAICRRA
jgi:pyruvate,water dikinase